MGLDMDDEGSNVMSLPPVSLKFALVSVPLSGLNLLLLPQTYRRDPPQKPVPTLMLLSI